MMTECFDCLFEVTKIVLILLHGNAQVESGFSINKDIVVENLHEYSIVAQHQVYDGIVHAGGVRNVEITKPVVKDVNMTHSHHKDDLKTNKQKDQRKKKRKHRNDYLPKSSRIWKQKRQDLA